jgi:hypothetical protein
MTSAQSALSKPVMPQDTQTMTLKEQLFQELDDAPDNILEQMLSDLRRLKVQPADTGSSTNSLTSLLGQAQGTFPNPAAVDHFIRQERDTWDS